MAVTAGRGADAETFALGTEQYVGEFAYDVRADRWTWSEEMYHLHGFEPGEVVPTTELVMSHKHHDEAETQRTQIAEAVRTGRPFAFRNRIVDATGHVRTVVIAGAGQKNGDGALVTVRGYMVDVTDEVRRDCTTAVAAAAAHRARIDEAKGMLMLVHGIDENAAFALLHRASNHTNTKLHVLADRLVDAFTRESIGSGGAALAEVAVRVLSNGHAPD